MAEAEDQQGELKHHICKFCNKRFPCGRSLGGHMRSHLTMNQSEKRKKKKSNGNPNPGIEYVPEKTPKLAESSSTGNDTLLHTDDKVCRECGKSFCSWKALFGHMKCHSIIHSGMESDSWNVIDSHSDSEEVNRNRMVKRSRSRIKRNMTNSSSLEEAALSLIMLSDSVPAYNSRASGIPTSGSSSLKNSIGMEQIPLDKKRKMELDDVNECSKKLAHHQLSYKHLEKRRRFQCCTCNKIFHSYQALGGHRASHKRAKGCEDNPSPNQTAHTTENNNILEFLAAEKVETSKKNIKDQHECPICFKIFPSGQALGGHKRSHLIAEAKTSQPIIEMQKPAVPETRDFPDLNLPAPTEEEEEGDDDDDEVDNQESHHSVGFQAWWMMESSHKGGQLLGPTF